MAPVPDRASAWLSGRPVPFGHVRGLTPFVPELSRARAVTAPATGRRRHDRAARRSVRRGAEICRALDYPAPSPAGATPWRRATLIAAAVAAIELAVIVVAGVAIFG